MARSAIAGSVRARLTSARRRSDILIRSVSYCVASQSKLSSSSETVVRRIDNLSARAVLNAPVSCLLPFECSYVCIIVHRIMHISKKQEGLCADEVGLVIGPRLLHVFGLVTAVGSGAYGRDVITHR